MFIAEIQVNPSRRRAIDLGKVAELAGSIAQLGLLNPVTVTEAGELVAGYHRVEACRSLGWERIPVNVLALTGLLLELAEIDENLIRADLTVLERGEHLKRRKEVYEALHPAVKHGGAPGLPGGGKSAKDEMISSFAEDSARKTGVTPRTVQQEVQIATAITEEVKEIIRDTPAADSKTDLLALARMEPERQLAVAEKIAEGKVRTVKEAQKAVVQDRRQEERETGREMGAAPVDDRCVLHVAPVGDLNALVPAGSVDLILTDPPYPEEFLGTYSELSAFAAHALKPGGSCLVMCGQYHLPEMLRRLTEHLSYHWTISYALPGGSNIGLFSRKVNTFWKPVVWLVQGDYSGPWVSDVSTSQKSEKDYHDWQQSESGIAQLVEGWSKPGEVVCDPFVGGGTTVAVALKLGRRVIAADIAAEAIEQTRARCGRTA